MKYKVEWTFLAKDSYFEEIEFIHLKWNLSEVLKFEELVISELFRLSSSPTLGKQQSNNQYSFVISKQTTLFYRINEEFKSIELLLFWNNLKNPTDLTKLL